MRNLITLLLLFVSSAGWTQDAAQFFSAGQQTNASADTVLATTGTLTSGGIVGANYEVSVLVNGSSAMAYKLEALNGAGAVVTTIFLSAPANQATLIDPRSKFFLPNGYSLRIRNNTAAILGATHQASIFLKTVELVNQ